MFRTVFAAAIVAGLVALPGVAPASEGGQPVTDFDFSFEGPFGTYDKYQLQRGLQIYNQVCATCHGLEYLAFRALSNPDGPALPEAQVKAIAANYQCTDPDLAPGDTRPCKPSDAFPPVTAMNAPDLTLMAQAREGFSGPYGLGINQILHGIGGPEYIASLLLAFTGETQQLAGSTLHVNPVFSTGLIAMPPPLSGEDVDYVTYNAAGDTLEGEKAEASHYVPPEPTLEQEAKDIAAFLAWASEPHMVDRKQAGLRNFLMLIFLAVLLWYTNKKLWRPVKHRDEGGA